MPVKAVMTDGNIQYSFCSVTVLLLYLPPGHWRWHRLSDNEPTLWHYQLGVGPVQTTTLKSVTELESLISAIHTLALGGGCSNFEAHRLERSTVVWDFGSGWELEGPEKVRTRRMTLTRILIIPQSHRLVQSKFSESGLSNLSTVLLTNRMELYCNRMEFRESSCSLTASVVITSPSLGMSWESDLGPWKQSSLRL